MPPRLPPRPLRIPIPLRGNASIGLGDVVTRATAAVGIKTCGGCRRRAEALNRRVVIGRGK